MKAFLKYSMWYLILISGLFVLEFFDPSPAIKAMIIKIDKALLVFFISLPIINISDTAVKDFFQKMGKEMGATSIIVNIIKIFLFIIMGLFILNIFNVSITPILATLGVGGLTIALALKDTLADFFAGFYLIVLKQVKMDHYIELASGEKGFVVDINWRNTKLRMLANNIILVPNSKMMQTSITNYELPSTDLSFVVKLGVHYSSDLDFVEKITLEVAKDVLQTVEGGVLDVDPIVRYNAFGDSSIDFLVILRAQNFVSQFLLTHELIKRLQKRFKQENIVIPFPIVAVNYEQEK